MYMHMESKYYVINKQGSKNTPRLRCLLLKYRAKIENIKEREYCYHILADIF